MIEEPQPALHPGMEVASDADHHLGVVDGDGPHGALARQCEIPRARVLRRAVDVVQRGVAIVKLDRLSDLRAGDARHVLAALLIDHHGLGGDREDAVAETALDVDERVLDVAVLHQHVARWHRSGVLRGAFCGAAHAQLLHRRHGALEADVDLDRPCGGEVEGRHGSRRLTAPALSAAARDGERAGEHEQHADLHARSLRRGAGTGQISNSVVPPPLAPMVAQRYTPERVMGRLRIGSEEHKTRFCREFVSTHHVYTPEGVQWPDLDPSARDRVRGFPSWDEAVNSEGTAGARVRGRADVERDPVLREAIAMQAYEEERHAALLDHLLGHYEIPHPDDPAEKPRDAEW